MAKQCVKFELIAWHSLKTIKLSTYDDPYLKDCHHVNKRCLEGTVFFSPRGTRRCISAAALWGLVAHAKPFFIWLFIFPPIPLFVLFVLMVCVVTCVFMCLWRGVLWVCCVVFRRPCGPPHTKLRSGSPRCQQGSMPPPPPAATSASLLQLWALGSCPSNRREPSFQFDLRNLLRPSPIPNQSATSASLPNH